jgi:hypothetical protein
MYHRAELDICQFLKLYVQGQWSSAFLHEDCCGLALQMLHVSDILICPKMNMCLARYQLTCKTVVFLARQAASRSQHASTG